MPTLSDVAAEAGVTKMTVSNVINGRRDQVSEATYERVMEVVQRLGYVRNATARSLSANRSGIIAFVYQSRSSDEVALGNPHDSILLGEVERSVSAAGLHLMVQSAESPIAAVEKLRSWNVDAAIFLNTVTPDIEKLRARHDVPLVFVDNYSQSPLISVVGVDDFRGGELAGKHLTRLGHRRLAWFGPQRIAGEVMDQRLAGFRHGLSGDGVQLDPEWIVDCDLTFESAVEMGERIAVRPDRPTAVFAGADILAVGLVKGLMHRRVHVPTQVSIVGFDDLPLSRQVTPELTTVRQDVRAKGRAAVELALRQLERLDGGRRPERRRLDVELMVRKTTRRLSAPRSTR